MSIPKPRKDSVEPVAASPSSPSKLFSPVVASLDQVRNHKITLLFKAIEQGDIPLVVYHYFFIIARCGICYWTIIIIFLFMDHFIFYQVMFHMKWNNTGPESGPSSPETVGDQELCHPLCQCPKCSSLQQVRFKKILYLAQQPS